MSHRDDPYAHYTVPTSCPDCGQDVPVVVQNDFGPGVATFRVVRWKACAACGLEMDEEQATQVVEDAIQTGRLAEDRS